VRARPADQKTVSEGPKSTGIRALADDRAGGLRTRRSAIVQSLPKERQADSGMQEGGDEAVEGRHDYPLRDRGTQKHQAGGRDRGISASRERASVREARDWIVLENAINDAVRLEARLNAVGFYEGFGLGAVWRAVVRPNEIEMPVVIMESTRYSARLPFMMYPLTRILSTGSASTGAKGSRWAFRTRTMSETRTHSSASSV
jgi:hypothetical protein